MTALFLLVSQSQWPHSPGGAEEHDVTLRNSELVKQFTNNPKPALFLWDNRNPITMHSWRKEKLHWIGHNFCSVCVQVGEISYLRSEISWVAFTAYCSDTFTTWKLIWFKQRSSQSWQKISTTLGNISTSMHERQKSSWCVRWHSKHCCLCRTELLFSAAVLCMWVEAPSQAAVCGRETERNMNMFSCLIDEYCKAWHISLEVMSLPS